MQRPGYREGNGAAKAAAQDRYPTDILHLSGKSQRAYKVLEAVALIQLV